MPLKDVMTPREMREYFRINRICLNKLCSDKKLKFIRINERGDRRFFREDVEQFLEENTDE